MRIMVHQFFNPDTIAVIGATADPRKFGNAVTLNLLENDKLQSEIFPVNPKTDSICGLKSYPSVLDRVSHHTGSSQLTNCSSR